jgi:hypothetical protein
MNKHGSKVINNYSEFKNDHINSNANRYKQNHIIQTFKTEKVNNKVCVSLD